MYSRASEYQAEGVLVKSHTFSVSPNKYSSQPDPDMSNIENVYFVYE